jgi:hypothetical protein
MSYWKDHLFEFHLVSHARFQDSRNPAIKNIHRGVEEVSCEFMIRARGYGLDGPLISMVTERN